MSGNLDSLRSRPSLGSPGLVQALEEQIHALRAKIAVLNLAVERLEGGKTSPEFVREMVTQATLRWGEFLQRMKGEPREPKEVFLKLSAGDWEDAPKGRVWMVEQLLRERSRGYELRRSLNKLEKRVAEIEARGGMKGRDAGSGLRVSGGERADWPAWLTERGWVRSPMLGHEDLEFWKLDVESPIVYNTPAAVMHQRSIERELNSAKVGD